MNIGPALTKTGKESSSRRGREGQNTGRGQATSSKGIVADGAGGMGKGENLGRRGDDWRKSRKHEEKVSAVMPF